MRIDSGNSEAHQQNWLSRSGQGRLRTGSFERPTQDGKPEVTGEVANRWQLSASLRNLRLSVLADRRLHPGEVRLAHPLPELLNRRQHPPSVRGHGECCARCRRLQVEGFPFVPDDSGQETPPALVLLLPAAGRAGSRLSHHVRSPHDQQSFAVQNSRQLQMKFRKFMNFRLVYF